MEACQTPLVAQSPGVGAVLSNKTGDAGRTGAELCVGVPTRLMIKMECLKISPAYGGPREARPGGSFLPSSLPSSHASNILSCSSSLIRDGDLSGSILGSFRCSRIALTTDSSVMNANTTMAAPHRAHSSASTCSTRRRSRAQPVRRGLTTSVSGTGFDSGPPSASVAHDLGRGSRARSLERFANTPWYLTRFA